VGLLRLLRLLGLLERLGGLPIGGGLLLLLGLGGEREAAGLAVGRLGMDLGAAAGAGRLHAADREAATAAGGCAGSQTRAAVGAIHESILSRISR